MGVAAASCSRRDAAPTQANDRGGGVFEIEDSTLAARIGSVRRRSGLLAVLTLLGGVFALYFPALRLELTGDDYQWVQLAHSALHQPRLLLADLDTFYRPASTWTLLGDRILWGHRAAGFHATNLALHAIVSSLLFAVALRLGVGRVGSFAISMIWLASPFTDEPAISVAIRFEDLLIVSWLALILAWPREREEWTRGRVLSVCAVVLFAMASKETWVVTPAIIAALELFVHRVGGRGLVKSVGLSALAALIYTCAYFLSFPGTKSYFVQSPAVLAKIPHELAAFLDFEGLVPLGFSLDWRQILAIAVVVLAATYAFRSSPGATACGVALLVLPSLPTLLVPYLPSRYTAAPYAGFLLLGAATLSRLDSDLPLKLRRGFRAIVMIAATLTLLAGIVTVRGDLADAKRVADAHWRLLVEASAVVNRLPAGVPILVARAESESPLATVAGTLRGLPKLLFPRHEDAYALADTAALFEWTLGREDAFFRSEDASGVAGSRGIVLVHRAGGFDWPPVAVTDVGRVAATLRTNGTPFRIIRRVTD